MIPELAQCTVGDLFVFSGIGVTILLGGTTMYLVKREVLRARWYGKMIGSIIFTTPFYLLSTFFILLYIIFPHPSLLGLGLWGIILGTLLLIVFQAIFTLHALGEAFLDYLYTQIVKRDDQANSP